MYDILHPAVVPPAHNMDVYVAMATKVAINTNSLLPTDLNQGAVTCHILWQLTEPHWNSVS